MAIHPFWAAHAVRQLEAEVADQLRYAGIVQDPRQRPPQALPRACTQTCSALLLAAMSGTRSLTASLSASLIPCTVGCTAMLAYGSAWEVRVIPDQKWLLLDSPQGSQTMLCGQQAGMTEGCFLPVLKGRNLLGLCSPSRAVLESFRGEPGPCIALPASGTSSAPGSAQRSCTRGEAFSHFCSSQDLCSVCKASHSQAKSWVDAVRGQYWYATGAFCSCPWPPHII